MIKKYTDSRGLAIKMTEHLITLERQMKHDEFIFGESFIEFTDTSIRILNSMKVKTILDKKGNLIRYEEEVR